ncbi:MAG: YbaB/EbfC family nucleoid-associated protein [Chlamydiia bacterium]|nr:YbaB/EbfC family nucleoid-associated protein [Chlamydiia bacterium]
MGSGFSKMKKQAKQFQDQLAKMQEEMAQMEVVGSAGNGLVEVTLSGKKEVKKLKINPECVDPEDVEGLEDLIIVAFNDAAKKIEDKSPGGGLDALSGLGGLPF